MLSIEMQFGILMEPVKWHKSIVGETEQECLLLSILALMGKSKLIHSARAKPFLEALTEELLRLEKAKETAPRKQ